MGSTNLEQHGRQDQMAHVARATVTEVMAGDRATTPIIISESELSSQISSDLESLESLGVIIRQGIEKKQRLEQQSICESPPSKRRHGQEEGVFVQNESLESIDFV